MCLTHQVQAAPISGNPAPSGAGGTPSFIAGDAPDIPMLDANGNPTGSPSSPFSSGDPISSAISAEQSANPQMISTPTKFSKLLQIAAPILEGGLVGLAGGKGHPSGGFGAANDWFAQKRAQQNQTLALQRQAAQTQAAIQARQQSNDIAQQRADMEDFGQPIAGQDSDGNPAFFVRNRRTGETKQVNGITPPDKSGAGRAVMTDQGLMNVSGASATPVTIPGPSIPPRTAMIPINSRDPNSALAPLPIPGIQGSPVPLHAPGFGKPQRTSDFDRYYQNYLDENDLDDTPENQLQARSAYQAAGRKPTSDNSGGLTGAAYTKRQSQYIDQLNKGFASSEQQRTKEINALAKDPTITPDEMGERQQQIEEENADRKQTLHERIHDAAAGQGIDLGDVPDYRSQLTDSGQNSGGSTSGSRGLPSGPPNGSRSNAAKIALPADVAAWSSKKNISIGEARRQFRAKGYTLQGNPQ
jgi:hypothetical protein